MKSFASTLNDLNNKKRHFRLHDSALVIPYCHKRELSHIFNDIIGIHGITHAEVTLVTPERKMLFTSSNPTLTVNLINSSLWLYDWIYSFSHCDKQSFMEWRNLYSPSHRAQLIKAKEFDYQLQYGFHLVRKINGFILIYSYATKNKLADHRSYYLENANDCLRIGDFIYRKARGIFQSELPSLEIPRIKKFVAFSMGPPQDVGHQVTSNHLRLVT